MSKVNCKEITIICEDGYKLAGSIFSPSGQIKGAVLIGPATGIKRQFYKPFAEFLAENDFAVLSYDNRGIGGSLHGDIKKHSASLQCWGLLDQPAAIAELMAQFPNTSYHLVLSFFVQLLRNRLHINCTYFLKTLYLNGTSWVPIG